MFSLFHGSLNNIVSVKIFACLDIYKSEGHAEVMVNVLFGQYFGEINTY